MAFRRSRGYRQRILWLIFLQPFSLSCPCLYFLHPFNLSQLPFPQELSFPLISPALTSWPLLSLRGHRRPCRPEKRNKLMPQAPLGGPVWLHEQRRGGPGISILLGKPESCPGAQLCLLEIASFTMSWLWAALRKHLEVSEVCWDPGGRFGNREEVPLCSGMLTPLESSRFISRYPGCFLVFLFLL